MSPTSSEIKETQEPSPSETESPIETEANNPKRQPPDLNEGASVRMTYFKFILYGFCAAAAICVLLYSANAIWWRCTGTTPRTVIVISVIDNSESREYVESDWTEEEWDAVIVVHVHDDDMVRGPRSLGPDEIPRNNTLSDRAHDI